MLFTILERKRCSSSLNKNQSRRCSVAGLVSYQDVTVILKRVQKDLRINLLTGRNIQKLFEGCLLIFFLVEEGVVESLLLIIQ